MPHSDHFSLRNVAIDLRSASKHEVLRQLADMSSRQTDISADVIAKALLVRENLGSTGIGRGIAIPHATIPGLGHSLVIVARLARPIDFDAIDDVPVDFVVLLLSPSSNEGQNLNLLSSITRKIRDDKTVKAVRAARNAEEILLAMANP